jgi:predicted aminopeptidase
MGIVCGALAGCNSLRFYSQAIHGQSQIVHRQRPIAELMADPLTPPALERQLRLILELRRFAEQELQFPADDHYLTYADLGRRFAIWNVYAAPEFSLKAKSWWYPIVGRMKYQGYFNEAAARRLGTNLIKKGFDVYVGGVQAYSTLGWFRDPVLNTFVFDPEKELAELLFHELAHQKLFVNGDTEFNEAFATAVAEEGVRRWVRFQGNPADLGEYEAELERKEQFLRIVAQARSDLRTLYEAAAPDSDCDELPPSTQERLRNAKQAVFVALRHEYARLKESWGGRSDYDNWFKQPLNNARLNTLETYYQLVPAFRNLLKRCEGRLERFFAEAEKLADMNSEDRREQLNALLQ